MSAVIFGYCLEGFHFSCIRYGPAPTTVGGKRVVCACPCHRDQHPDDPAEWKASDADRVATAMAFEFGVDPRVEQILDGISRAASSHSEPDA